MACHPDSGCVLLALTGSDAIGPRAKTGYPHTRLSPRSHASVHRENPNHTFYLRTGTNLPTTGRLPYHNRYRGHHSLLARSLYSASGRASPPLFLRLCKRRYSNKIIHSPPLHIRPLVRYIHPKRIHHEYTQVGSNHSWYWVSAVKVEIKLVEGPHAAARGELSQRSPL